MPSSSRLWVVGWVCHSGASWNCCLDEPAHDHAGWVIVNLAHKLCTGNCAQVFRDAFPPSTPGWLQASRVAELEADKRQLQEQVSGASLLIPRVLHWAVAAACSQVNGGAV